MSIVVPHKKSKAFGGTLRKYRSRLTKISFGEKLESTLVLMDDGTSGRGTCLGCGDAPCKSFLAAELSLHGLLKDFPSDPTTEVCPTNAIDWDYNKNVSIVVTEDCISCGLCIARCPYGAIYLTESGAVVEAEDPDCLTVENSQEKIQPKHPKVERRGIIGPLRDRSMKNIPKVLLNQEILNNIQSSRFVRNLLIQCGFLCNINRSGDTNVRIDGVLDLSNEKCVGVIEIELRDPIEIPRLFLEDIVVANRIFGVSKEKIHPIAVLTKLPNLRSEYYRVIDDIEKILNIRCRTITVGVLLTVIWQFKKFSNLPDELFFTQPENVNLLPPIKQHFQNKFIETEPYPGAFQPSS